MSTTITGKLNKDARVFQAGDSTGFGMSIGVKYYDRKTKSNEWTNYKVAVFAKVEGQVNFYTSSLVAGSVVEVSAQNCKIDSFQGNDGPVISIELLDAKIGFIHTSDAQQAPPQTKKRPPKQRPQQPQQYQPQGAQGQGQSQQPQAGQQQQQAVDVNGDWDDDIPF